jgi:hypothetical protein
MAAVRVLNGCLIDADAQHSDSLAS